MIILILRWLTVIAAAFLVGKLVSKLRLPSILGWLITGMFLGPPTVYLLKKTNSKKSELIILCTMIIVTSVLGFICNTYLMPSPVLNFMLMGMAFSAVFSNIVSEERLSQITADFNPVLGVAMIIVILNLGAPLDYHAVLGAGLFTVIYILARGAGKYFGARAGAKITGMPEIVQKYLGFTLLPHSGVSLVFTGIVVSVLADAAPECTRIIQGTIAAKKGFEWAGELSCVNET